VCWLGERLEQFLSDQLCNKQPIIARCAETSYLPTMPALTIASCPRALEMLTLQAISQCMRLAPPELAGCRDSGTVTEGCCCTSPSCWAAYLPHRKPKLKGQELLDRLCTCQLEDNLLTHLSACSRSWHYVMCVTAVHQPAAVPLSAAA
jgi:hypothetical protein